MNVRLFNPHLKATLIGFVSIGLLAISGCESVSHHQGLYYWGEYENVLHSQFTKPGKMPAHRQVEILSRDITKAEQRGLQIAPGVYAQLGTALADLGDRQASEAAFKREILLYPESALLIEGMLQRANKAVKRQGDAP